MKRITKLSEANVAALARYRDEWLRIGLDTQPLDKRAARSAVEEAYRCAGLRAPSIFVFLDSPWRGAIASAFLKAQVGDQVGAQVWAASYGSHDASWLTFYEYFRVEMDLPECERLAGVVATAKSCGWWWPFVNLAIVTAKPVALCRDGEGRLHCEDGLALTYPDGWGVYAWHGVRVPSTVILSPETITAELIAEEENAEVRRVMMERMGWERFCDSAKMRVLHADQLQTNLPAIPVSELVDAGQRLVTTYRKGVEDAELLQAEGISDLEGRPLRFVRLTDPSTGRRYAIRVLHSHTRCYEAVGWTFGMTEAQYKRRPYLRQGDVMLRPLTSHDFQQQHS